MYKIKPNGNYNLIIADLNITLLPGNDVVLTDLEFENSIDIKNILHYLNVEKIDSNNEQEKVIVKEEIIDDIPTTFVAHLQEVSINEGIFVKNAESKLTSMENVKNVEKEIKEEVEIKTVSENIVETNNVIKEKIVETIDIPTEKIESEISASKNDEKKVSKSKTEKKLKAQKEKVETVKSKKISSKKKDNKAQ